MARFKSLVEDLLTEERDRQVAQLEEQGEKAFRWGYTVRKYWRTPWGVLKRVRIPRLRNGARNWADGEIPSEERRQL